MVGHMEYRLHSPINKVPINVFKNATQYCANINKINWANMLNTLQVHFEHAPILTLVNNFVCGQTLREISSCGNLIFMSVVNGREDAFYIKKAGEDVTVLLYILKQHGMARLSIKERNKLRQALQFHLNLRKARSTNRSSKMKAFVSIMILYLFHFFQRTQ